MKKPLSAVLIIWLALSGTMVVWASHHSVDSDPYLFSVIKTDKSINNNITVVNNTLFFTPGTGTGNRLFGFQPGSTYYYRDLVRVRNNSRHKISVWYTLDGELADLYTAGVFSLDIEDTPGIKWAPLDATEVAGLSQTGAIDFYFQIPPGQQIKDCRGHIIFFAAVAEEQYPVPDLPETGGLPRLLESLRALAGLLLFVAGLLAIRKRNPST